MAKDPGRDVAIVGMAAMFPEAPNLAKYWLNLQAGVDAIREVPPSRWDPIFYDPKSDAPDRVYCRRGGFVSENTSFDALAYGIMPVAVHGAEPDQLLSLEVAAKALADAGYGDRPYARERAGVILGRGGYLTPGIARLTQYVRTAQQLVECLRVLLPELDDARLEVIKKEFQLRLRAGRPDTSIGLVPNLAASRIANRLDLHGPAYTVDAACASSLVAVDHAVRELTLGSLDLVLAGGVHICHDITFWSVFSQLGALSRSQQIRPFDRRADGLLIGEGVGVVVLKRLADAERDQDRIYAVIRGTGVSSDGRESSLMNPRVAGQVLALERAWAAAGVDPSTVGLVEAHGTGTPAGDEAELTTLAQFFGPRAAGQTPAGLGSVKSMIGHAMPAAGAAGLIKAALAVYHGIKPPTLHAEEPHPRLADTRFALVAEAEAWDGEWRRAGVNAFGFGGINAHVVLQSHERAQPLRGARALATADRQLDELLIFSENSPRELLAAMDADRVDYGMGPCRLALLDPTPERREKARQIVERGKPWRGRRDIWFAPRGLLDDGGKVAFVFPGVEATFEPRVEDVAARFDLPLPVDIGGTDLEQRGVGIVGVGRLMHAALGRLAIEPDVVAGHSIGEWTGMIATGMVSPEAVDELLDAVVPGSLAVPDVAFAALGCGAERAEKVLLGLGEVAVSHDNCPHQSIICGREASVDVAIEHLKKDGVLCQKLPFKSGFHSPMFAEFLEPHREHLARLPIEAPRLPLWSATTCAPYPQHPDAIRALALDHLVRPVRFHPLVEKLYEEGVRVFIQAGTGSLIGFIDDALKGRPHLAISANVPRHTGLEQLLRVGAALFVEGASVRLNELPATTTQEVRSSNKRILLELGTPLVRLEGFAPLALAGPVGTPSAARTAALAAPAASGVSDGAGAHPILCELTATLAEIASAQNEIWQAWQVRPSPPREPQERRWRETLSVDAYPELADHTFYRQPPGWPVMSDRYPVVPMTMFIDMMMEKALAFAPQRKVVGLEGVYANRWLAVAPPVDVEIAARYDGRDRVVVRIGDYSGGTVLLADAFAPAPPAGGFALKNERPAAVTAERLYEDRWMFHGPAYRGVADMGAIADDGIRGTLLALPARGALLDNAGQLMGYWVMVNTEVDRLAFPFRIKKIQFFAEAPRARERVECRVRMHKLEDAQARSDMELSRDGRVFCVISAWDDRRFDTDRVLWPVLTHPEHHSLAERRHGGYYFVGEHWRNAASRDLVARRYLNERERAEHETVGPRKRREWLLGRIAAKDAVREWLWKRGRPGVFPIEVAVENDVSGRPRLVGPFSGDLHISIAHKDDAAVAIVGVHAYLGIDLERVEARSREFAEISFHPGELRLGGDRSGAEWMTRLWAAKEAVAKARGTGLEGRPRAFEIKEVDGERLRVDSDGAVTWVETRTDGDYIVAWTVGDKMP